MYFDNGRKIPLPSLGLLHHPRALGVYYSGFSFPLPVAMKRVQHGRRTLGFSGGSLDRKHTYFPRMYIKASYPSGGIRTGNRRDSPHEDDDITLIVFFVFHPPPNLQPV